MSRERSHENHHGCITVRSAGLAGRGVGHPGQGAAGRRLEGTPSRDIRSSSMPTIVVDVMPKAELLDPQGKAVAGALARLGVEGFGGVRIGKRFELAVDGEVTEEVLAVARSIADEILSNSVIEDVVGIEVVE